MNKQNKPIDYRDLLAQDDPADGSQSVEEDVLLAQKKKFSLDDLKDWWMIADSRTKWEIILMVILAVAIIATFSFYFSMISSRESVEDLYAPDAEEVILN